MTLDKTKQKQQMIADAAIKRFLTYGYAKTTISEIAGDVGLSKTAIYHYFPSKDAILLEIMETMYGTFTAKTRAIFSGPDTFEEKLVALLEMRHALLQEVFEGYTHTLDELFLVLPIIKERKAELDEIYLNILIQGAEEAVEKGELASQNPRAFARLFQLLMNSSDILYHSDLLSTLVDITRQDLLEEFKAFVRRGLR